MAPTPPTTETTLATLEKQVEELTGLCDRLVQANQVLIQNCNELQQQQRTTRRKNREAGDAVKRILSQLQPYGTFQ